MKKIAYVAALGLMTLGMQFDVCRAQGAGSLDKRVNAWLSEAAVGRGVESLSTELRSDPDNDDLRFALGFLQFGIAVQNLGRSWHRYGLRPEKEFAREFPFMRFPVPVNPAPEPVGNEEARGVLQRFIADLMECEATLARIKSETVHLGVQLGRARLDLDGDGIGSEEESLWRIYAGLNRRAQITQEQADGFLINLDAGDVQWLRGYCHLLSAALEFYLAHDDSKLFDHTAHLFFENPKTPYPFLKNAGKDGRHGGRDYTLFADAIALIHLIDLPVADAERSRSALGHLRQVIELSRRSWELYGREIDDDCEWIPNPRQTGVIPGVKVTEEMVSQWMAFLDEAEALLSGKLLIPFWRGEQPVGVNLERVFTEPGRLDLVLWVQGTAAAPYIEQGTLTKADFWRRLMAAFNGRFIGFALWFN